MKNIIRNKNTPNNQFFLQMFELNFFENINTENLSLLINKMQIDSLKYIIHKN